MIRNQSIKIQLVLFFSLMLLLITACKGNNPSGVDISDRLDWRTSNIMTSVKNQDIPGSAGTCWAFASVGMLEAVIKKDHQISLDLAEQHLINTVPTQGPIEGVAYLQSNGVLTESEVPYTGRPNPAFVLNKKPKHGVRDHELIILTTLSSADRIIKIKDTVRRYGPLLVSMTLYSDLDAYSNGIYSYNGHAPEQAGHIVLIVGWDYDQNQRLYWICKNSWGESWGLQGYFNIYPEEAEIGTQYAICIKEAYVNP